MKKLFLLLCIAFVVVCYAYPCFVLPFGEYKMEKVISEDQKIELSLKFDLNKVTITEGKIEQVYYYKVSGGEIVLSEDTNFTEDDNFKLQLNSMYEIGYGEKATNEIGMYIAIGVGALAVILVLLPNGKKR